MAFETYRVKLVNAQQARTAIVSMCEHIKPWLIAGHQLVLEVIDEKTRKQERLVHSCYRDLARDCLLGGLKQDEDAWKRALLQAFYEGTKHDPEFKNDWKGRAPRFVPALDGDGAVLVSIESRGFTKRLYSAFITFVHSTGDARGARWSRTSLGRDVPDEYFEETSCTTT